jgi:hypothetical protein
MKARVSNNRGVRIAYCACKNDFQEKQYGQGLRVFNHAPGKDGSSLKNRFRCTVCGREKDIQ